MKSANNNYPMLSFTFRQLLESKHRKFYNPQKDIVVTKQKLKTTLARNIDISLDDKSILVPVPEIIREEKIHSGECEFALGDSCQCWCGEKYHGWKGRML